MCSLAHSVGGGLGSLGCEVEGRWGGGGGGHLVLLDQEALNHAGSSWKGPKGNQAGPAGPEQAG